MKVTLEKIGEGAHFRGSNEAGDSLELGNNVAAVGPMQSVLMAAAGCSSIDILMILGKQKVELDDFKVEVEGTRREETPRTFTDINLHFIFVGKDLPEEKLKRSIDLSLEKYCSVSLMLQKAAKITSSYEVRESA